MTNAHHKSRVDSFIQDLNLPDNVASHKPPSTISFLPDEHINQAGEIFVDPKELEKHF
jgi:hypothetical protein